mgnify:CR=1 FL=1
MPSSKNYRRNYKQEYNNYHSKPKQRKNRVKRTLARRAMEAGGKVSKGDGKDVDHKRPLSKGRSNSKKNLRVKSATSNRSFSRKKGSKKYNPHKKGKK